MPVPRITFDTLCSIYGEAFTRRWFTPMSYVQR